MLDPADHLLPVAWVTEVEPAPLFCKQGFHRKASMRKQFLLVCPGCVPARHALADGILHPTWERHGCPLAVVAVGAGDAASHSCPSARPAGNPAARRRPRGGHDRPLGGSIRRSFPPDLRPGLRSPACRDTRSLGAVTVAVVSCWWSPSCAGKSRQLGSGRAKCPPQPGGCRAGGEARRRP
jgi:hypothetical protein